MQACDKAIANFILTCMTKLVSIADEGSIIMKQVQIKFIEQYLPESVLSNDDICRDTPTWTADKILQKTGIESRHIAAFGQTSVDLGINAAQRLFDKHPPVKETIDYLIFCTQTPDHFLPTSACIIQDKLGLPKTIGAIDINQGCSGYVYGLSLAKGLITAGLATNILFITADTYTKLINPKDISVRTLFGDGATATVVSVSDDSAGIGNFVFGTNGRGAQHLIVPAGGFRMPRSAGTADETLDLYGNVRSQDQLYMDGSEILIFGLGTVPKAILSLLEKDGVDVGDVDLFIFHQASLLMLQKLAKKLGIPAEKVPLALQFTGNTVSSTIPITLQKCFEEGRIVAGQKLLLAGFGVGLSWAACMIQM